MIQYRQSHEADQNANKKPVAYTQAWHYQQFLVPVDHGQRHVLP
jgi:hypothetical protein